MNQIDIYKNLNESYPRKLIHHFGTGNGFYSELNSLLFSVLFCLQNKLRLELYSKDAPFTFGNGWGEYFECLITNLVVIITTLFPIPWQYECLITRIPIFVLGILIYLNQRNTSVQKELFLLTFASFIICSAYNLSSYYLTATFCPLLLLLISRLGEEWPQAEKFHIKYKCFNIGKYTLEIFLGNSISYYVLHLIAQHTQQTVAFHFTYWSTTILLSILFIWTNNFIMREIHFNSGNIHF